MYQINDKNDSNYSPRAVDLINWFLAKESMTQKKIQKLAYYSQAFSLVFYDRDIVENIEFEAWVHGPVNVEIRNELVGFRWYEIELPKDSDLDQITKKFSTEANIVLEEVWNAYGHLTACQLETLTHMEEPWLEQRNGLGTYQASKNVISKETMKRFYSEQVTE